MTNEPLEQVQHEKHLSEFKASLNGNRNDNLNKCAIMSFGLAMGNKHLAIAKVESDYTDAGNALAMDSNEIKKTLASALSAAQPFELTTNGATPVNTKPVDLVLAPTYTALEDYAMAHGVPVAAFEKFQWTEGEYQGRKCLKVPHEDSVIRCRFLDGEQPKWKPIGTGHKPCWYSFKQGIAMATKAAHKTIVICNGQPSVIAAQHHGVPAIAQTDGEGQKITAPLLKRLRDAISENELKVILAYDGDAVGRKATKDIQKQLIANGIPVRSVQFGGDDHYDLADHCKLWKSKSMEQLQRMARYGQAVLKPVVSRSELTALAYKSISATSKNLPAGELLVTPFKSFHKLGGFAFILHPGKSTMILAPSGHGKTSFMETWSDFWNRKGFDTLWFSPEWSPLSMQYRAIQRYSGISTDVIASHVLYTVEAERGIAPKDRQGVEIKSDSPQYQLYNDANDRIAKWTGEMYALQGQKVTGEVLEDMSETIWLARRKGRRVGAAFFDYVQILRTDRSEENYSSYETICSEITQWERDMDIHAIIGSQPTKTVGENSISTGAVLNEYDAMWMRPDVAQLIITLNIKHNKDGDKFIKTDFATANICKNNTGRLEQIPLRTNFKYLSWKE